MKRVVLALALTGLMCVTAQAGNIPTSDIAETGHIPTNDDVPAPTPATSPSANNTSSSVALADVILMIVTLINR